MLRYKNLSGKFFISFVLFNLYTSVGFQNKKEVCYGSSDSGFSKSGTVK